MTKFDKLTKKLGWIKPYEDVNLWYQPHKDGLRACFDINKTFDMWLDNDDKLTIEIVQGNLNFFPKSIFKESSKNWVLPLLASDYFAHRQDFENELIWAKKAIEENSNLTSLQFSKVIREIL